MTSQVFISCGDIYRSHAIIQSIIQYKIENDIDYKIVGSIHPSSYVHSGVALSASAGTDASIALAMSSDIVILDLYTASEEAQAIAAGMCLSPPVSIHPSDLPQQH